MIILIGCGAGTTAGSSAAPSKIPVLTPIGNKTVAEGAALNFTVYVSDSTGTPLLFSSSILPGGAVFYPDSRTFIWTPGYTQSGSYNVTFMVRNGWDLTAEQAIIITVTDVNVAPALATIGNRIGNENSLLAFTVSASDAGGDALTYSAAAPHSMPQAAYSPGLRPMTRPAVIQILPS